MFTPSARRPLASALAGAFLAGPWVREGLLTRGRQSLEPAPRWLPGLVDEVAAHYHRPPVDRPRELAALIDVLLEQRRGRGRPVVPRVVRRHAVATAMGRRRWPVPVLDGVDDLARFLGLDFGRLAWLADARGLERRVETERLRNYRYRWLTRGAGPPRVIERPKGELKAAQRRVLDELLIWIPPHDAVHGFIRGRSARTHAAAHVGHRVVIRLDLEDFFASVAAGRVFGVLRTAGYPEGVAHALTALCTNVLPVDEWAAIPRPVEPWAIDAHHRLGRRLATPHLPQGAPTSPALANLCAFSLDRRLAGLAAHFGARYTRYANDLAFSGDDELLRRAAGLRRAAERIVADEGFRTNPAKSQQMTSAGRQRLCGVVVNRRLNVSRREYDTLKAMLHNAAVTGPAAQNRAGHPAFRAHLLGRIAWVASLHPERGARLRERFEGISWDE